MYLRSRASERGPIGSPYYVGKGEGWRAYNHNARCIPMPKNRTAVLIVKQNMSEQEAFAEERRLISHYGRIDLKTGCLRNRTDGGEGASGRPVPDSARLKNSLTNKGKRRSPATEFKPGHVFSDEHRARLSAALKGRTNNPKGLLGRKHTPEAKAKMAEALKAAWKRRRLSGQPLGRPHTEAAKEKMSIAKKGIPNPHKGQVFSPESRAKMSASQKLRFARERAA